MKQAIYNLWLDYRSEVIFGAVLILLTVLSYWLGAFIPEPIFEYYINPLQYISTATVCFFGAILLFCHKEQTILRRSWAAVLLVWGCVDVLVWAMRYIGDIRLIGGMQSDLLFSASVTLGNTLAFMLFIYPTQVLRPGWLNWWRAMLLLLPMIILGVVDYFVQADLLPVLMVYPVIIFLTLCRHIRKYRQWCEDNFSTLDDIDVQWIVRYLTMLAIIGISFYFIVFWYVPNRMFTQQWMFLLLFSYTTIRVLYRPDPWKNLRAVANEADEVNASGQPNAEYRTTLEAWMDEEKPYLNPDFQLMDLQQVLPLNRTYLSQFINSEYGCNFYRFVTKYRIEEAKRLLLEQPDLKRQDVSAQCGFSSTTVFTRAFTRETGMTPREWLEKSDNS